MNKEYTKIKSILFSLLTSLTPLLSSNVDMEGDNIIENTIRVLSEDEIFPVFIEEINHTDNTIYKNIKNNSLSLSNTSPVAFRKIKNPQYQKLLDDIFNNTSQPINFRDATKKIALALESEKISWKNIIQSSKALRHLQHPYIPNFDHDLGSYLSEFTLIKFLKIHERGLREKKQDSLLSELYFQLSRIYSHLIEYDFPCNGEAQFQLIYTKGSNRYDRKIYTLPIFIDGLSLQKKRINLIQNSILYYPKNTHPWSPLICYVLNTAERCFLHEDVAYNVSFDLLSPENQGFVIKKAQLLLKKNSKVIHQKQKQLMRNFLDLHAEQLNDLESPNPQKENKVTESQPIVNSFNFNIDAGEFQKGFGMRRPSVPQRMLSPFRANWGVTPYSHYTPYNVEPDCDSIW